MYLSMDGLSSIDPCTLLYVMAQMDRIRALPYVEIAGSYPASGTNALRMLKEAEFERFFRIPQKIVVVGPTARYLEVRRGSCGIPLEPEVWRALRDFVAKRHDVLSPQQRDELYNAFGECISNVPEHAFKMRSSAYWYAMAVGEIDGKPARAVVADIGTGIPNTVRRNFSSRLVKIAARFSGLVGSILGIVQPGGRLDGLIKFYEDDDWRCLQFACRGEWRESTDPKRGTGLNGLRDAVHRTQFASVHVISGSAQLTMSANSETPPVRYTPLKGTIICVELAGHSAADPGTANEND